MSKKTICWALVLAIVLAVPASAELIGYWKLDQDQGEPNEFWDETDYWNDGTIAPMDEAQVRWSTAGYDANCLEFVSPEASPFTLCDVPMPAGMLNVSEASYAFWMNMPSTFQAWGIIFVLIGQADDHSLEPDGAADVFVGRAPWFGTSGAALGDDQWHHIAVTFSSSAGAITIYVDGKAAASTASSISDAITTVRIGGPRSTGRSQWRRFIGRLDEVAVWNHALSAADVKNVCWFGPQWTRYATAPEPGDAGSVGTVNVTLRWTPGETAAEHHVYIGENADDVANGTPDTDMGTTTAAEFSGYTWELGKKYYWRVDEVEADGTTVYPGVVWSFTVSAKYASSPVPANGAILVDPNDVLSWIPGSAAVSRSVYLGTDPANLPRVSYGQTATTYDPPTLEYGMTYYWRVDESDASTTYTGEVWSFKTKPLIEITDPDFAGFWNFDEDENGTAIDWSGNDRHGTIMGDPAHVEGYSLGALSFDGIDDRVDVPQPFNGDLTMMAWIKTATPGADGTTASDGTGLFWSNHANGGDHFVAAVLGTKLAFETGPGGNPNTTSARDIVTGDWVHVAVTRNGSSLVQLYIDGGLDSTGTHTGDTNVWANPRIVIGANPLTSRYFQGEIDEVRAYRRVLTPEEIAEVMRGNLLLAWNPRPAVGEVVDVRSTEPLSWSPGDGAAQHDVYFGTDEAAVVAATPDTAGIYKGRQAEAAFSLAEPLQWLQTYYWRVDEVGADGTVATGRTWMFTVADYLLVDTFESYTNDSPNRVFQTWIDGYGFSEDDYFPSGNPGNGTGAALGHNIWSPDTTYTTIMETRIVHGGKQSMPFYYDNRSPDTQYKSEADRKWAVAQDWTLGDVDTLQLFFRGNPVDFVEDASGNIRMSGAGTDIWYAADEFRFAYKTLTGNGSMAVRVDSLMERDAWSKVGVMIRQSLEVDSAFGAVYMTGGNGVRYQARLRGLIDAVADDDVATAEQVALQTPVWVKIERVGGECNGYYSADGVAWVAMSWNPQSIVLNDPVFIGLAITSHSAGNASTAELSGVKTTGGVSGSWQVAEVGGVHLANSPADLYVRLKDTGNNTATVKYPGGALITDWTQWDIPLADFTGVNPAAITQMTIGAGDPDNPQQDGDGLVYIDDVRVYKAAQ
jgi:hypothetical protein